MEHHRYPYDEQNKRDFEQTTDKIHDALEQIRRDSTLKATGKSLAKLAGVSRKTLYNRGWPAEELKSIKEERRESEKAEAQRGKDDPGDAESREEKLESQIENLKTESAVLFHDLEDAREQVKSLERENERLQTARRELKSRLDQAKISDRGSQVNSKLRLVPDSEATDTADS